MPLDWNDLRYLHAVGTEGSLAGAARALKVDQSTASRRLAALEEQVGKKLFTRSPEGMKLTAEGEVLFTAAKAMAGVMSGVEQQLDGLAPQGNVRLATTEGFAPWMAERLVTLNMRHPELSVQLLIANAAHDVMRGEADIALRLFRPSEPTLVVRRLGTIGWSLYASDQYLAKKGDVKDLETLAGHDVLGFDEVLGRSPGGKWLQAHAPNAVPKLRASSLRALAHATASGLGVSVLPCMVAASTPLRRLTSAVVIENEAFLVVHPDLKDTPRVRTVLDFLAGEFAADAKLLSGQH